MLELIAAGSTNKDIAAELGTSQQAVKQQVSRLLARFGVESRAALARSVVALRVTGQDLADVPLEYLFDRAPIAIAITAGPDHVVRAVNRAFRDLFGDRNGWVGLPVRDLLRPGEAALLPLLDSVFRSGKRHQGHDVPLRWADAGGPPRERLLTLAIQPTLDTGGATTGLVFFGLAVTTDAGATRARPAEFHVASAWSWSTAPAVRSCRPGR